MSKLKARKFWELFRTFVEVTGGKLAGENFRPRQPNLNEVKIRIPIFNFINKNWNLN